MRVVLYGEGAGDIGAGVLPPAPGKTLWDELLGPAHVLVASAIGHARRIPRAGIQFEQPLRTRGRLAKGSDLVSKRTLRQLLSWANPAQRPDLAVVLVDRDGQGNRRQDLLTETGTLHVERVIAVAVEEFEAWLISDQDAVTSVLGPRARLDERPEDLPPREAKRVLAGWCAMPGDARSSDQIRLSLALHVDPEKLRRRSTSFAQFLEDLSP